MAHILKQITFTSAKLANLQFAIRFLAKAAWRNQVDHSLRHCNSTTSETMAPQGTWLMLQAARRLPGAESAGSNVPCPGFPISKSLEVLLDYPGGLRKFR